MWNFLPTHRKEVNIIKTNFLIIAPTGAGKDTVTNMLAAKYNLKVLLSYTTRPKRSPDDDTHIFLTENEAQDIIKTQTIIAITLINNYLYFSTLEQFINSDIYIVDAKGVEYIKANQHLIPDINLISIYIKTDKHIREDRLLNIRGDNKDIYIKRTESESEQFDNFLMNEGFDWVVNNNYIDDCFPVLCKIVDCYI